MSIERRIHMDFKAVKEYCRLSDQEKFFALDFALDKLICKLADDNNDESRLVLGWLHKSLQNNLDFCSQALS